MSQSEWSDTGQFRSGQQRHWRSFFPLCWPYLLLEFQGTRAATNALSDNTASRKKKKERERGREERRIFFAFLIWGRTILQKISGDFPSIPMVRTGAHALPWVIKRDMLQGSHTFSLFSGRRDSPAKKGMVNPHGKAGNIVCPYPLSLCPHPPLLQVVTGHLMPKEVTRPGVNQVGTRRS